MVSSDSKPKLDEVSEGGQKKISESRMKAAKKRKDAQKGRL
jgi:hypothetical protein